ncbi:MAG: SWIM zinc finger family protein, partial [Giesbergeria sp.]
MSRMPLTADAVAALSPDDASTKAARGLVAPAKWPVLGASDAAVWGECQGSGSKPYQTQVDVSGAGPTFRCSCPSRKFPCKHGLALLLLQAQTPQSFTATEPAWVSEWLASRQERAEKKEAKAAAPPVAADPAASAKREAQRTQRMAAGAQELARWLDDTSRKGLAAVSESDGPSWATMAARMVDAQAPGLGQRVTQAFSTVGQGRDWHARLLGRLGNLQLLVDAVTHSERLTPGLQADLRQALGWPLERDEVLTNGERLSDQWQVLAEVRVERDARLIERRVWLQGVKSQRRALLVDFSFGGKAFEQGWSTGVPCSGTLAFYPSADPLRALLVDAGPVPEPTALA